MEYTKDEFAIVLARAERYKVALETMSREIRVIAKVLDEAGRAAEADTLRYVARGVGTQDR